MDNRLDFLETIRAQLTPIQYEIFRLRIVGFPMAMIARKVKRSLGSVGQTVRNAGARYPNLGLVKSNSVLTEKEHEIFKLYQEGWSPAQIAVKYGTSRSRIVGLLKTIAIARGEMFSLREVKKVKRIRKTTEARARQKKSNIINGRYDSIWPKLMPLDQRRITLLMQGMTLRDVAREEGVSFQAIGGAVKKAEFYLAQRHLWIRWHLEFSESQDSRFLSIAKLFKVSSETLFLIYERHLDGYNIREIAQHESIAMERVCNCIRALKKVYPHFTRVKREP